jgi:hypothetical protein
LEGIIEGGGWKRRRKSAGVESRELAVAERAKICKKLVHSAISVEASPCCLNIRIRHYFFL